MFLAQVVTIVRFHGYVSEKFGHSVVISLIKDECGDVSQLANYRGISLSPSVQELRRIFSFQWPQDVFSSFFQSV